MPSPDALRAFNANPSHATLRAVENVWLETIIGEALQSVAGYYNLVHIARTEDRTYALAAKLDQDAGAILSYTHWLVCPRTNMTRLEWLREPTVTLESGSYGSQSLTEAALSLGARIGTTV